MKKVRLRPFFCRLRNNTTFAYRAQIDCGGNVNRKMSETAICQNKRQRACLRNQEFKKNEIMQRQKIFKRLILLLFFIDEKQTENILLGNHKVYIISQYPYFTLCGFLSAFPRWARLISKHGEDAQKQGKRNAVIIKADEIAFTSVSVASFILIHSKRARLKRMNGNLFA